MTIANKLGNLVSGFIAIAVGTVLLGEVTKAMNHIRDDPIKRHSYPGCPKIQTITITKEQEEIKEDYFTKSKFD